MANKRGVSAVLAAAVASMAAIASPVASAMLAAATGTGTKEPGKAQRKQQTAADVARIGAAAAKRRRRAGRDIDNKRRGGFGL